MDKEVLYDIIIAEYVTEPKDTLVASLLRVYLEEQTVEEATKMLERVFPVKTENDGMVHVSGPELAALISVAQEEARKNIDSWFEWKGESSDFSNEVIKISKSYLLDELDGKRYVADERMGVITMLHDCLEALKKWSSGNTLK